METCTESEYLGTFCEFDDEDYMRFVNEKNSFWDDNENFANNAPAVNTKNKHSYKKRYKNSTKKVNNKNRWRCLTVGCNPVLYGEKNANAHKDNTGHRVAKWAVRSAEGKRRAKERNKNGYYDKYNVGYKAYENRFF